MRIAIIGDLQFGKGQRLGTLPEEIDALSPDLVVVVGDYGYGSAFGDYEVLSVAAEDLRKIRCKELIPLLGNHDVQWEAGEERYKAGTVRAAYTRAFGFPPENRVIDCGSFNLICLHTDIQTKEEFICHYENRVSDGHFAALKQALEAEPDKPAVLVTHAPPAGCGLLTVPMVHIRAANGFLDQDHDIGRWRTLLRDERSIMMWFNGHYHMGHDHEGSHVTFDGAEHFLVGTTFGSRDGQRQSRILDVDGDVITVSTYDHNEKVLREPEFTCRAKVRGEVKESDYAPVFPMLSGEILPGTLRQAPNGRYFAMTTESPDPEHPKYHDRLMAKSPMLWEIDRQLGVSVGAVHYSDAVMLDDYEFGETCVWRLCGDKRFGHRYDDPNRFMREKDYPECRFIVRDRDDRRDGEVKADSENP